MVLTEEEREYLDAFEQNEFRPELPFDDKMIIDNIQNHPMVLWKMS